MPASLSWSRMLSAVAKSFAARARARRSSMDVTSASTAPASRPSRAEDLVAAHPGSNELAPHGVRQAVPGPALLGRLRQNLVIDVGDVADERHLVPAGGQPAAQHLEAQPRPNMADMWLGLQGHAAQVDANLAVHDRNEVADLLRRRVVDPDAHSASLLIPPVAGAGSRDGPHGAWPAARRPAAGAPKAPNGERPNPNEGSACPGCL